jgi:hypothetical protein
MTKRVVLAGGLALLAAVSVSAQTKVSGTAKCSKPDPDYNIDVGDRPGHLMLLEKVPCTWTDTSNWPGEKPKDGYAVGAVEITATKVTGTGTMVSTTEASDKMFVSYRDSAVVKDGKTGETRGTWSYTGGTGKLKGIKGGGTFKLTFSEDGATSTLEVEGEYTMPQSAAAAKK